MFISRKNIRHSGFTLVEVVLAVLILALLGGVLFTLVESTLGAAVQLNIRQKQTQELNGLIETARETFATLDGRSQFTCSVKPAPSGGYIQEIRIDNGPLVFSWQGTETENGTTTIAPRPQANGLLAFCLLQEPEELEKPAADAKKTPKWFVLVRDLKKLDWRFFDARSSAWRKEWEEAGVRPSLIELTIQSPANLDPTRVVFPMLAATPK